MAEKKIFEKELKEICQLYQGDMSSIKIGCQFGISGTHVRRLLEQAGVPRRSPREAHLRYRCNEDYFADIESQEQAYWLGLLGADGSIEDTKAGSSPSLILGLKEGDKEHIQKFAQAIEATHPIHTYYKNRTALRRDGSCIQSGGLARLQISSPKLCADLISWGVRPRKDATLRFPQNLPAQLLRHYVRGFTDGDGGLYFQAGESYTVSTYRVFNNRPFLLGLQSYLMQAIGLSRTKLAEPPSKSPEYGSLVYNGRFQVPKIIRYLCEDATIFLARKWETAIRILEYAGIDSKEIIS